MGTSLFRILRMLITLRMSDHGIDFEWACVGGTRVPLNPPPPPPERGTTHLVLEALRPP